MTSIDNFQKINLDNAKNILETYENNWIYIKTLVFTKDNTKNTTNNLCMYSKMLVSIVNITDNTIFLYGTEDKDRIIIDINSDTVYKAVNNIKGSNLKFINNNTDCRMEIILSINFASDSNVRRSIDYQEQLNIFKGNIVITEGKTDWKHLKKAWNNLKTRYSELEFDFYEFEHNMGSKELLSICKTMSKFPNPDNRKIVCIFDADEPNIIKKVNPENLFKDWGNNVYSFTIPVPEHRENKKEICIEHYYTDSELMTHDVNNRRLYLGYEFSQKSGSDKEVSKFCQSKDKCGSESIEILDDKVYYHDDEKTNIALSKNEFAKNILEATENFKDINSDKFTLIFDKINEIINSNRLSPYEKFIYTNSEDIGKDQYKIVINSDDIITIIHTLPDTVLGCFWNKMTFSGVHFDKCQDALVFHLSVLIEEKNIGVNVPILLDNFENINVLHNISEGCGQIDFILINDDKNVFLKKTILSDEIGRSLIFRELDKAYQ